jgi:alkylation response protein AidB-like acyl-CoA dehydrogenase
VNDLMDVYFSDADRAFQAEVRAFLRDHLRPAWSRAAREHQHLDKNTIVGWHRSLARRGWSAPSWPREFGGPGWSAMQRYIFDEECANADAPPLSHFGIDMVGPVIYTFGSAAQKARYLPRILSVEDCWCQGYSEPGAGSDLASLRTRAVRDGAHYVINGSKIWTSEAHMADLMFCLVRTDPEARAQRGISFVLIDMQTPGITIRPILSIDGGHALNEVFFDDVRIPLDNLVGEENMGWKYAKFLLGNERAAIADAAASWRRLQRLKAIAQAQQDGDGRALADSPLFAHRIAGLEIELLSLSCADLAFVRGEGDPAMLPSLLKLRGSEVLQAIGQASVEALGYLGMPYAARDDGSHQPVGAPDHALGRMEDYLFRRSATIYGGSSETQKNIVAKMIFGR